MRDESPTGTVETSSMRFSLLLPESVLLEADAVKIVAEATNGSFALLPRHIDWVAPIVPGLILVTDVHGKETIIGVDEGTLVKCGQEVMLATRRAVVGDDLSVMRHTIETRFLSLDEREVSARTALARLEAGIVRRFIELEDGP
jgi:F-type H+-transporting ATPase subunit epsilon